MKINKWDFDKHIYNEIVIDDKYNIKLFNNVGETINCANCLKEVKARDTYTSLQYHNKIGLGYYVCEECYIKELKERNKSELNEIN